MSELDTGLRSLPFNAAQRSRAVDLAQALLAWGPTEQSRAMAAAVAFAELHQNFVQVFAVLRIVNELATLRPEDSREVVRQGATSLVAIGCKHKAFNALQRRFMLP